MAARLPAHLDGLWRALAPRAGPELTQDPLGLLLSAIAAGLGILLLTAGVLRAGARVRLAVVGVAVLAVVIVPTMVAMRVAAGVGRLSGAGPVGRFAAAGRPRPAREGGVEHELPARSAGDARARARLAARAVPARAAARSRSR